jgi:hypothetical protein
MGTKVGIRRINTPFTLSVPPGESVSNRIRLRAPVIVMQILLWQVFVMNHAAFSQTSSTRAIVGVVLDISGSAISEAAVEANGQNLVITRSTESDAEGRFVSPCYQQECIW